MLRLGIDLGGTKIEGIALDHTGSERARRRVATPRSYEGTLEAIAEVITHLESAVGEGGTVGLGIPGSVSPSTWRIRNANSTWLNGEALGLDLESLLGRPVRVRNDADCFAISEATDGAGQGAGSVFGVILGTGVGGGIVVSQALLSGASGIAGEWGHTPLPPAEAAEIPGPSCWCGRTGCVESWLSGPGMAADHERIEGIRASADEIASRALDGDEASQRTLDRHVTRLGRALAVVVNILDPEVVVLGGGVSNIRDLAPRTEREVHRHVFSDRPMVRVRTNMHGDSSGVRGAAWLWAATGEEGVRTAAARTP